MFKECRHVRPNGLKCGSPALRGSPFCYFHSRPVRPGPRRKPATEEHFELPPMEDAEGIHCALVEVANALAESRISLKRARAIIDSLQLAERVLHSQPIPAPDTGSFDFEDGDERLAPILRICTDEDDCSRCEFASTCANPQRQNYP